MHSTKLPNSPPRSPQRPPSPYTSLTSQINRYTRGRTLLILYLALLAYSIGLYITHHRQPPDTTTPYGTIGPKKPNPALNYDRANATFVTLARNSDLYELLESIQAVEDRFNHRYAYDWVFLNDQEFTADFIAQASALVSGRARFALVPQEHWSFPKWINRTRADETRHRMAEHGVLYGDSISYRHMCRYESGFFFRHPLMNEYRYYWRVEPSIKLPCHIPEDLFKFMEREKTVYGFTIAIYEFAETVETLWKGVKRWMGVHAGDLAKDGLMDFVSDDGGESYNLCHFWSNFEIADADWLRSPAYLRFFNYLDREGGFFYERWGDAPVHSIAAALMLDKSQVHLFDEVGYYHVPFTHCPNSPKIRRENKCTCDPHQNFDWNGYSCMEKYYGVQGLRKPNKDSEGWW